MSDGLPLFIEGPFSINEAYTEILASLYPASDTYITSLNEATAFGTAILSKASAEHIHPLDLHEYIHINKMKVPALIFDGFEKYIDDYLKLI